MRKQSEWNILVKKIFDENKSKPGYRLSDAMKEASAMRKSGETNSSSSSEPKMATKKSKKRSRSRKCKPCKTTKRKRHHHH